MGLHEERRRARVLEAIDVSLHSDSFEERIQFHRKKHMILRVGMFGGGRDEKEIPSYREETEW